MPAHLAVALAAAFAAALTLYSGFGLGTLLLPVFALFFPPAVAVAATAVVHGANNLFKLLFTGRHTDRSLLIRFGLPAIVAAAVGASLLGLLAGLGELASYPLLGRLAVVTPLKLVLGILMVVFALFELLPRLRGLRFDRRYLAVGGVISGFFGGLSGHQGALRAAFLTKVGISTEAFVGTSAAIGFVVDLVRTATYAAAFALAGATNPLGEGEWPLVATGCAAAFAGVVFGSRFLHKIRMKTVQTLTGVLLLAIGLALGSGWL
jgi:uncharacterized membrane protein YfcA